MSVIKFSEVLNYLLLLALGVAFAAVVILLVREVLPVVL